MTRVLITLVAALACALPAGAQLESYSKAGTLSELRVGDHYWGAKIDKRALEGKVVLVQMAGL